MTKRRHAPRSCPVCGDGLAVTRLSCPGCQTHLSGEFESCSFCSLSADQREMLGVFLTSRGNMKALERHLGVSYPTARARYDELLTALGGDGHRLDVLRALSRGDIDVSQASDRID